MFNNTLDRCDTVSQIFVYIWGIYYWNIDRYFKNAITWSIFELEECSFFLNMSEFCKKLIGYVISELCHQNVYSAGKTSGVLWDGSDKNDIDSIFLLTSFLRLS